MGEVSAIVMLVVALWITGKITKAMNRNTFGTTGAYIRRFFLVFIFVGIPLSAAIVFGLGSLMGLI